MARAFNQEPERTGPQPGSKPRIQQMANQALHTLMGIARRTTGGEIALENFSRMAGRAKVTRVGSHSYHPGACQCSGT
jgi:hypothetical protein